MKPGDEIEALIAEAEALWRQELRSPRQIRQLIDGLRRSPWAHTEEERLAHLRSIVQVTRTRVGPPPGSRDVAARNRLARIPKPSLRVGPAYDVCFAPGAARAATLNRRLVVHDLAAGAKPRTTRVHAHPSSVDFSPCGRRIALKHTSGRIAIVRFPELAVERHFRNQAEGEGPEVRFTADGEHVFDASWAGQVAIRSIRDGEIVSARIFAGKMVRDVAVSRDRTSLACLVVSRWNDPEPSRVVVWRSLDLGQAAAERWLTADEPVAERIALSPNGAEVAICTGGKPARLLVVDVENGGVLRRRELPGDDLPGEGLSGNLDWSPCGRELVLACRKGALVLDARTLCERFRVPMQGLSAARYAHEGDFLGLAGSPKTLLLERQWLASVMAGAAR